MNEPTLNVTGGLESEEEGYATQQMLVAVFERCLRLQQRKAIGYGEAWRSQGYVGNVGRVLSKVARLRNMVWRDIEVTDVDEAVEDTLEDLVVLCAFALINWRARNRWGRE